MICAPATDRDRQSAVTADEQRSPRRCGPEALNGNLDTQAGSGSFNRDRPGQHRPHNLRITCAHCGTFPMIQDSWRPGRCATGTLGVAAWVSKATSRPMATATCPQASWQYRPELPPVHVDVSFTSRPEGRSAFVAPSGASKTTVFSLIERFYEPASGRVLVDGKDVQDWAITDLRAAIGTSSRTRRCCRAHCARTCSSAQRTPRTASCELGQPSVRKNGRAFGSGERAAPVDPFLSVALNSRAPVSVPCLRTHGDTERTDRGVPSAPWQQAKGVSHTSTRGTHAWSTRGMDALVGR